MAKNSYRIAMPAVSYAYATIQTDLADFAMATPAVRVASRREGIAPQSWDGIISIFCHLPSELRTKVYR